MNRMRKMFLVTVSVVLLEIAYVVFFACTEPLVWYGQIVVPLPLCACVVAAVWWLGMGGQWRLPWKTN